MLTATDDRDLFYGKWCSQMKQPPIRMVA